MSKNPWPSSQLPDRSPAEIQEHYEALQRDITLIESAPVESLNLTKNCGQEQVKEEGTSSQKITKKIIPKRSAKKKVHWTEHEHRLFLLGLKTHGKGQWQAISRLVLTSKTPTQIASHAQKYFLRQKNMPKKRKRASIHDITLEDIDLAPQQNQVQPLIPMQQSSPQQNRISSLDVPQQLPIQNRVLPLNVPQQSFPYKTSVFPWNVPRQLPDQQSRVLHMSFPQQSWHPPSNVLMQQWKERKHTLEDSYLAPLQYHWAPPLLYPPMEQLPERPHVQEVFQPEPNGCLGTCCYPGTLAFTEKQKMNGPLMNSDGNGSSSSLYFPNTSGPIRQCGTSNEGFMHFRDGF